MKYYDFVFKIYDKRDKINSVLLYGFFVIYQFFIAISSPELFLIVDLFNRIIYIFLIPIIFYFIIYLFLYIVIKWICYKLFKNHLKNSQRYSKCVALSGELKVDLNETKIKKELKEYLNRTNYQFKFDKLEDEMYFFFKYIKEIKNELKTKMR